MITNCLIAVVLWAAGPITPQDLDNALQIPPQGAEAKALADQIHASFPRDQDLTQGGHLVARDLVAFVVEAPSGVKLARVVGMVNHSRGLEMVPIGATGLWARVEPIPTDTKFAYKFEVDGKEIGGAVVEMPDWSYPPESKEQPGVTYGSYQPLKFRSKVFNNDRTGWIYVPAGLDAKTPAKLMVFEDGDAYKNEHVGTVVDNLMAKKQVAPMILVLLNPGTNDDGKSNRSFEYDSLDDRYATFLADEVLPLVQKDHLISPNPDDHAIAGASSGGICSFTVAWHRPDLFRRVLSQIGSFTNIRGGNAYPDIVRKGPKKPIRVLLTDGTNDLINQHGDWWQANNAMFAALTEQGYDARFIQDRGFHAFWTCGRQLPEAIRWVWSNPSDQPK